MAPGSSTDFKELVRSRTDIVELIGETVGLEPRRGGRVYVGLCPFHDDHNPSMQVDPERQSFKCWSCGEGGDCFSFVMKIENLGFREVLEMLARRANLELPKSFRGSRPQESEKADLYRVLEWAEDQFHQCLLRAPEAERARAYLKERGFTAETVGRFRLGYHPPGWQWLMDRARGRFGVEQLFRAKLVRERRDGSGYYDDFRDRVLFPIRDSRGRPVAFGGRILPDHDRPDAPKYLNSPESELFAKSRLLYGFDVAREAVRRSETAIVVEGYTDCTMAHQHGVANVVGTLGTALTETHVLALKRFARKVVLVYDGDEAGRTAAERSLPRFLAQDVDLRILTLPEGQDPADCLAGEGADAFRERIERAEEAWKYKLRTAVEHFGLETVDARHRVLDDMLGVLVQAPRLSGTTREDMILAELARTVSLTEFKVRERLRDLRTAQSRRTASPEANRGAVDEAASIRRPDDVQREHRVEWELLEIIFAVPETVPRIREQVGTGELTHGRLRELLQVCYDLDDRGEAPGYDRVTAALEDSELKRLAMLVDESSQEKRIAEKAREERADGDGLPGLLERLVAHFQRRREQQSLAVTKGRLAQAGGTSGRLGEEDKALLEKLTAFRKKQTSTKAS